MGGEMRSINVVFTTPDCERLPPGMYSDDVAEEIVAVLQKALAAWYEERGNPLSLVVCEPDVI